MIMWHWSKIDFKAMNTQVYVWLYSPAANSDEILQDVKGIFSSMDCRLSRFNPESELSALNQASGPFVVSSTLLAVIELALWAAEVTGGLFDPTILLDLERAGYQGSFETVAPDGLFRVLGARAHQGRGDRGSSWNRVSWVALSAGLFARCTGKNDRTSLFVAATRH